MRARAESRSAALRDFVLVPTRDADLDVAHVEDRIRNTSALKIRDIIDRHPDEAMAILRNWMRQGG